MLDAADIDWVVISLKRTPERLQQFRAATQQLGLRIEALEAVDGLELDREDLEQDGLISVALPWGPGAIGAALSHRQCWLGAIKSNRPVCIFEDDVVLRHDFAARAVELLATLPDEWDLIHFGYNTDSILDVEAAPGLNVRGEFDPRYSSALELERFAASSGRVAPARLHRVFGACCYAVSPRGANKLIEGCFPLSVKSVVFHALRLYILPQTSDVVMNGLYQQMHAYVCLPPVAMPINDKKASTVQA